MRAGVEPSTAPKWTELRARWRRGAEFCVPGLAGLVTVAALFVLGSQDEWRAPALAVACGAILILTWHAYAQRAAKHRAEARAEELADRNWELRDAEERARTFLDAQGDFIVRRDAEGVLTYANDAFCAVAGKPREQLVGIVSVDREISVQLCE